MREDIKIKEKMYKRQLILDAAANLFFYKGVKSASMDELAKESGLTKRTIYCYFESKEEIYYEVMLRAYKELNSLIKEKSMDSDIISEIGRLKTIGEILIQFNQTNSTGFNAIFNFENTDIDNILKNPTAAKCYEEGQYLTDIFINTLKEGIQKGEIKESIDINKTFLTLWASLVGMAHIISYKKEYVMKYFRMDINESLSYSFDLIINSIRKEESK